MSDHDQDDTAAPGASIFELFGDPPPEVDGGTVSTPAVSSVFGNELDAVPSEPDSALPHWTEPPTGQLPKVLADAREGSDDPWAELQGPRWHGDDPAWADDDLAEVFGAEDRLGVADDTVDMPKRVTLDDLENDTQLPAAAGAPQRDDRVAVPTRPRPQLAAEEPFDPASGSGGRNLGQAVGVGVAFAVVAGLALQLGAFATLVLVLLIVVLASAELFAALREAGFQPATLFGIVAAAALPAAVYARDERMVPLIMAMLMIFGALWWIVGADTQRPALNLAVTQMGVLWVGGLASFAALLLKLDGGVALVFAAIVVTVATDTGAYAMGRAVGRTPFHAASPNKTVEGTIGGICFGVIAAMLLWLFDVSAYAGQWSHAVFLGLVGAVMAVLGDLTESLIKRDLGVKDMGTILPGHGGILDRMDGLLFVLPAVYYLTLALELA